MTTGQRLKASNEIMFRQIAKIARLSQDLRESEMS